MKLFLVVALFVSFLAPLTASAQQNVGAIRGVVTDPSGGLIIGANVLALHLETGVETRVPSNENGAYSFPRLSVGLYNLSVSFDGFRTIQKTNLRIVSGVTLTQDIELPVGETSDVVSVSAQAELIDTSSTASGNTRTLEEIRNLPLQISGSFRSTNHYLATLPGFNVNVTGGDADQTTGRGSHMGGPGGFANNFVEYTVDGVSGAAGMNAPVEDNGQLVPETVEEIRYTTNLDAESGGNIGTAVVLVTKSGTNRFHGDLYHYLRNEKLDARQFFAAAPSPNKQNEYGFVLGGPIIKNKLFFFSSWDQYKYRVQAFGATGSVPTALMRRGDFSEWLGSQVGTDVLGRPVYQGAIYDPLTNRTGPGGATIRDPFPGNVIPADRLNSISRFFQEKVYPLPTRSGTQQNWLGSQIPATRDFDRFSIKIDSHFWTAHKLSVGTDFLPRKQIGPSSTSPPTGIVSAQERNDKQYRIRIVDNWTLRSNVVVSLRAAYNRYKFQSQSAPGDHDEYACQAGLTGTLSCAIPLASIQAMSGFGSGSRQFSRYWTSVPIDLDMSIVKGRHSFKFGVDFLEQITTRIIAQNPNGTFNFNARETGLPAFPTSGVSYASYLLGEVDSATLATPRVGKLTARSYGVFAQDQWRATSKLTVNYGLRWDLAFPLAEKHDRIGYFDPTVPNPAAGGRPGALTFWGSGTGRNGRHYLYDVYWRAFGPRLGLAYQVDPKTVIRAYYGLVYTPLAGEFINGQNLGAYGWDATVGRSTLDAGITSAFNWMNGFPNIIPVFPNVNPSNLNGSAVDRLDPRDGRPARGSNLGLTLEHELPGNLLVKAEYVGKWIHGLHAHQTSANTQMNELDPSYLSLGNLLNANISSAQAVQAGIPLPYPGFTGTVNQALKAFPQYTGVAEPGSRAPYSLYNGLSITAQKRFGAGLSFLAGYVVSKHFELGAAQHRSLLNTGRSLMSFDIPQNLIVSYSYQLPFGPGKPLLNSSHPAVKWLAGGWEVSGTHRYASGTPIAVSTRGVLPGIGAVWANRVASVPIRTNVDCANYDDNRGLYLNPEAFATPAPFTFGNTRLLPDVRNCGTMNEDISIMKSFPVRESVYARLGASFFNAFNRHTWGGLVTDINNPTQFGRFTSVSGPRTVQVYLKVQF